MNRQLGDLLQNSLCRSEPPFPQNDVVNLTPIDEAEEKLNVAPGRLFDESLDSRGPVAVLQKIQQRVSVEYGTP